MLAAQPADGHAPFVPFTHRNSYDFVGLDSQGLHHPIKKHRGAWMTFDSQTTDLEEGEHATALPRGARPRATSRKDLPKIVSLFAGAGGLDLGFKQAGFTVSVAIDAASAAIRSYKRNFPRSLAVTADLTALQPRGVLAHVRKKISEGSRIAVIGGPPCQGFSRANIGALRDDPRNKLPTLYLEIVRELQKHYDVEFLVIENVLGIRDKKHAGTYNALVLAIGRLGFDVTEKMLCATDFGVPQNRKRIILSCMRKGRGYSKVKPRKRAGLLTVRDAIGHVAEPALFQRSLDTADIPGHPNNWTMMPKSTRFLTEIVNSSSSRSFKRLQWDLPSPTIAFGNREIHVHPNGHRRLSIYEAMLLQGFPHDFVLEGTLSEQVAQVSNAVPPPLGRSVALAVKRALKGQ